MSDFIFHNDLYRRKRYVTILFRIAQISFFSAVIILVLGAIFHSVLAGVVSRFIFVAVFAFELLHYKAFFNYTYRGLRFALLPRVGKITIMLLIVVILFGLFYEAMYMIFPLIQSTAVTMGWIIFFWIVLMTSIMTSFEYWNYKKKYSYPEFMVEKGQLNRKKALLKSAEESCLSNKYDIALDNYEELIEMYPDYYKCWCERGIILNELKRYHEALESFSKVVDLASYNKKTVANIIYFTEKAKRNMRQRNILRRSNVLIKG